jgi:sulfur carrier protein ThiS
MIKLSLGTNTTRTNVMVEAGDTLKEALAKNNVSTNGCAIHLNGTLIAGADLDQTFDEMGVADGTSASLIAVVKADSAR